MHHIYFIVIFVVDMSVFPAFMYVYNVCSWCLMRSEVTGSSQTGFKDGYELHVASGNHTPFLWNKKAILLTAKLKSQHLQHLFLAYLMLRYVNIWKFLMASGMVLMQLWYRFNVSSGANSHTSEGISVKRFLERYEK